MNIIPQMDNTQQDRREVLSLGFEKYSKLMHRAIEIVRKANKKGEIVGKEKEEFLQIPLIIRQKAIEQVSYENL